MWQAARGRSFKLQHANTPYSHTRQGPCTCSGVRSWSGRSSSARSAASCCNFGSEPHGAFAHGYAKIPHRTLVVLSFVSARGKEDVRARLSE